MPSPPTSSAERSTSGTPEPGVQLSTARTADASSGMFDPFTISCVMSVILPTTTRADNAGAARYPGGSKGSHKGW
ncbi:protein of unknown function [Streptantibioticus cattleyicolor NRRL 8057 = DSM 46488]|nr:protein of unknown function [Streptantibioticus cattleyicolor NRRL 8057 = DSM 46488]